MSCGRADFKSVSFAWRGFITVVLLVSFSRMAGAQSDQAPSLRGEEFPQPTRWTYGSRIVNVRPGSQVDRFLKVMKIQGPLAVATIDSEDFYNGGMRSDADSPEWKNRIARFKKLLHSSTGTTIRLVLGSDPSKGETLHDLQIDEWDDGIELGQQMTVSFSRRVRVSPERFTQAISDAFRFEKIGEGHTLAAIAQSLYPKQSDFQAAVSESSEAVIQARIQRAHSARASGDWQRYASILKQTLREFQQSQEGVESLLSADVKDALQLLANGDGAGAIEIANWVKAVTPDSAVAERLLVDATSQVRIEAIRRAEASEATGSFDRAQAVLIAALKIVPDSRELQTKLAAIQKQLELADLKKAREAKEADDRAASGRQAAKLAELSKACRSALDRKDYPAAQNRCADLISAFPAESVTKTLMGRLQAEIPARVANSASDRPNAPESRPQAVQATLHPYDLLQNPFQHKNQLVQLDGRGYPIFANGVYWDYMEYQGNITAIKVGHSGLRFNRMLQESAALYDVMVHEGRDMRPVGQLVVRAASPPSIEKVWIVQPSGTTTGTNAFGAPVAVPEVRFVLYADERALRN